MENSDWIPLYGLCFQTVPVGTKPRHLIFKPVSGLRVVKCGSKSKSLKDIVLEMKGALILCLAMLQVQYWCLRSQKSWWMLSCGFFSALWSWSEDWHPENLSSMPPERRVQLHGVACVFKAAFKAVMCLQRLCWSAPGGGQPRLPLDRPGCQGDLGLCQRLSEA